MTDSRPWIANAWYAALWAGELAPGALVARTLLDLPVVMYRKENGAPVAVEDCCMHRFAPLHLGRLLPGDRLQCGYHGLEYDPLGRCVANPHGNGKLPLATIRTFPALEKHGMVWLWMGEDPPDAGAVPDLCAFDDVEPRYHAQPDYIKVDAGYRLVLNNLLDLSHIAYVHPGLIGNDEMVSVERTEVREAERSVTVARSWPNVPVSANLKRMYTGRGDRGDKWNDLTWTAPCAVTLAAGYTAPGAPRADGAGIVAAHLLTPETRTTTHYFFSAVRFNPPPGDDAENAEILAEFARVRRYAFESQDAPIIAAQQRMLATVARDRRPVLLSVDEGAARYNRILDRLLDDDQRRP